MQPMQGLTVQTLCNAFSRQRFVMAQMWEGCSTLQPQLTDKQQGPLRGCAGEQLSQRHPPKKGKG